MRDKDREADTFKSRLGEKKEVVTLMEKAGVGVQGGEKTRKDGKAAFEKDAACDRGYIFVVHIHI